MFRKKSPNPGALFPLQPALRLDDPVFEKGAEIESLVSASGPLISQGGAAHGSRKS